MPTFDSFLIARASTNMATQDERESGNLSHSSSDVNHSQLQVSTDDVATRSAFEITSVSDSNNIEGEENEGGTVNTNDAEEMKNVIKKGGRESNWLSSSSGGSETAVIDSQNSIDHMTGETNSNFTNIPVNPSPKPQDTTAGPLVGGPSRFRKINYYPRGRWYVRDTYEPEERPESEAKLPITPDTHTGNSPIQVRKYPPPPSSLTTSEYSYDSRLQHSRSNSEASFVTDQHVPYPSRDTSTLSDKSSVIVDTYPSLSRTESNSSLITKSLDEDGDHESRSRDVDLESVTSIPNTHTPDLQSNSSTYNSIERPPQKHCETCSKRLVLYSCSIIKTKYFIMAAVPWSDASRFHSTATSWYLHMSMFGEEEVNRN